VGIEFSVDIDECCVYIEIEFGLQGQFCRGHFKSRVDTTPSGLGKKGRYWVEQTRNS